METTVEQKNSKNFEVKEILICLGLFLFFAVGYSAYTDIEQLKRDCANPISKECTSNIIYTTYFVGIPKIFGYDIQHINNENKSQQVQ